MITADQIVAHLVGDYILQSDWMASEKTKRSFAAAVHAVTYGLVFIFFRPSLTAFAFIVVTHFAIDRWRLARYVCWLKNFVAPPQVNFLLLEEDDDFLPVVRLTVAQRWRNCSRTGYYDDAPGEGGRGWKPPFMSVWLMIIADNTMHLILNGIALKYL